MINTRLTGTLGLECDIDVGRGERGDTIELRLFEGWVQWKHTEKDVWENIISVEDLNGRSIEYQWNGTSLGVRIEGDAEYTFVNLKGEKGDTPSISHLETAISDKLTMVEGVINEVNANEVIRISNENTRISSESARVSSENQRVADENIRKASEVIRQTQEASRQESMTNIEGRFDSKIIEVDSKIAESAEVISATNAVKDATESVRVATELVKNETLVVKDDTVVVKNATNIVKSETEAVKNNTESVRIATETVKGQAESKIVDCETRMKHIEDNFDNLVDGTGFATTVYVDDKVSELVSSAPETLDTLKELADALGNDPNFATTVSTEIGKKADKSDTYTKSEVDGIVNALDSNLQNHLNNHPQGFSGDYNDLTNRPVNVTTTTDGFMSKGDKVKLDSVENNANNYVHPNSSSTRHVSDSQINTWNNKSDAHSHPYKPSSYVPTWSEVTSKPISSNITSTSTTDIANSNAIKLVNDKVEANKSSILTHTTEIESLKQSSNNCKNIIATAIGTPLTSNDTFGIMGSKIDALTNTFKTNLINKGVSVTTNIYYITGLKYYSDIWQIKGTLNYVSLPFDFDNISDKTVIVEILNSSTNALIRNIVISKNTKSTISVSAGEKVGNICFKNGNGWSGESSIPVIQSLFPIDIGDKMSNLIDKVETISSSKKWAEGFISSNITFPSGSDAWKTYKINTNIDFIPSRIILMPYSIRPADYYGSVNVSIDSKFSNNSFSYSQIKNGDAEIKLYITIESDGFTIHSYSNNPSNHLQNPITWEAYE